MVARIKVEQKIFEWATQQTDKSFDDIDNKFPKFEEWVTGEIQPTLNQLIEFSTFTKIPFGYLVLKDPPTETLPLLEFRTVDTEEILNPSRELLDTIKDMEKKQEWMREYLIDEGYSKNDIVKSIHFSNELKIKNTSKYIKEKIGITDDWYKNSNTRNDSFNYLKQVLSDNGILVMQNGTALGNTHRPLNVNEFRAFALVDDYAPLIFINTQDTQNGKVFSILHELTHIFLGVDSLYNKDFYKRNKYANKLEVLCNAVAAEIAVPIEEFQLEWKNVRIEDIYQKVSIISDKFKISSIVIARKALDTELIAKEIYYQIAKKVQEDANKINRTKSGGNAIHTAQSRLDKKFVYALSNSLDRGYAVYTDIYKLTGLSRNVFEKVEKNVIGRK